MAEGFGGVPEALLRTQDELPFVEVAGVGQRQLLQVDLAHGVWVLRFRFPPGRTVQTHKHTGHVFALTLAGRWFYVEYPESVNEPGSYLYEPAGSVHTLQVPDTNDEITDVWFAVHGANLNLDAEGSITSVTDAHSVLA